MARPTKSGLDYFPLDVDLDDKVELIEAKHGIVGFGVVIKLFQSIYKHGYYLKISEEKILLLKKKFDVDIKTINEVIDDCLKWGVFNPGLYNDFSILSSKGIQKRYIEATKRRKEVDFIEEYLLLGDVKNKYPDKVNVFINKLNVCNNPRNECNKKQTKVKESKVKENKEPKYNLKLTKIFNGISIAIDRVDGLPKNSHKKFNARTWAVDQFKSRGHPGAILESLNGIYECWDAVEKPYGYVNSIMKTKSGNYHEADAIQVHEEMKKLKPNELIEFTHGLFKEL